jgi:hypothetical protein
MTIDSLSGLISWTPASTQLGSNAVAVRVSDGKGGTASQSYSVTVEAAAANQGPSITSAPVTTATTNAPYAYAVVANDPNGDPLAYSLITAPTGMSIDGATGLISWTPVLSQIGSHAVTLRVDDGLAFAEQSYFIEVTSDALPLDVFISVNPQIVDLGATTTVTVVSEGGVQPATLSLTVNGTPVSLDAVGQITLSGDAIGTWWRSPRMRGKRWTHAATSACVTRVTPHRQRSASPALRGTRRSPRRCRSSVRSMTPTWLITGCWSRRRVRTSLTR